jgi:hypothetical protein
VSCVSCAAGWYSPDPSTVRGAGGGATGNGGGSAGGSGNGAAECTRCMRGTYSPTNASKVLDAAAITPNVLLAEFECMYMY